MRSERRPRGARASGGDPRPEGDRNGKRGDQHLDDGGRFVYVNEAYTDIYGYDPEELVGEHWELLYFDEDFRTIRQEVLPEVSEEGQWRRETRGKRKDGAPIVEDHSLAATGDGGLICTVRDVTDRKRRERRIEALHEATRTPMAAETRSEVAERAAEAAKETLDYPFTVVRLLDDEANLAPVAVTEEMRATMGGERPTYAIGEEPPAWRSRGARRPSTTTSIGATSGG